MTASLSSGAGSAPASRLAIETGVIRALAWRDAVRLVRERSRWLGLVAQPLLFWVIMGSGMSESFTVSGTGVGALTYFYPGVLGMLVLFT